MKQNFSSPVHFKANFYFLCSPWFFLRTILLFSLSFKLNLWQISAFSLAPALFEANFTLLSAFWAEFIFPCCFQGFLKQILPFQVHFGMNIGFSTILNAFWRELCPFHSRPSPFKVKFCLSLAHFEVSFFLFPPFPALFEANFVFSFYSPAEKS